MLDTTDCRAVVFERLGPGLRRVTGATAAVLAATALAVATAPDASADVTTLHAVPGMSWGPSSQYGTNCTYTLTATINAWMPVSFYDFTEAATFSPSNYIQPTAGSVSVQWTPTRPGWHHITAYQTSAGGPSIDLLVGTGVNTGSACVVLP